MAVCIAVIGKENSPLYISCSNPEQTLDFHFIVHRSLDVVDEKLSNLHKTNTDLRDLYLGLLYSSENHKIFGYATNTKIKFIVVVESANTAMRENDIRGMFRKLHSAYSDMVCNPFYMPGEDITSKKFEGIVKGILVSSHG